MTRNLAAAFLILASACVTEKSPPVTDTAQTAAPVAADTAANTGSSVTPPPDAAPATPSTSSSGDRKVGDWDVTPAGIGPLRAGMTLAESKTVTHDNLAVPAKTSECDYVRPKSGPKGIAIMFEKGVLSRVDVTVGTVKTVDGAGIGDSEDRIKSLYPGQVKVTPHKYTDGHYLVVTPAGGGENRIVFETDGKKVTRFRSGREPAVEYVEGCA